MGLWSVDSRSMAIAPAPCSGDLQRITGGLLTEMALVMPRTGRRAYILLCMVPGRGDPSVRCRRCDHRLVLTETRQALLMELRIGPGIAATGAVRRFGDPDGRAWGIAVMQRLVKIEHRVGPRQPGLGQSVSWAGAGARVHRLASARDSAVEMVGENIQA